MQQNVTIIINDQMMKAQFDHCPQCSYFSNCYRDGNGPYFLDSGCLNGPA